MLRVMPKKSDEPHDWSDPPKNWAEEQARRVALEVRRVRDRRPVQWLADRTKELGSPVTRSVISDLELGRRRYVTTSELVVLAQALEVSPLELLFGSNDGERIEYLPHMDMSRLDAVQRFSGINEGVLREYETTVDSLLEAAMNARAAAHQMAETMRQMDAATKDLPQVRNLMGTDNSIDQLQAARSQIADLMSIGDSDDGG